LVALLTGGAAPEGSNLLKEWVKIFMAKKQLTIVMATPLKDVVFIGMTMYPNLLLLRLIILI